MADLPDSYNNQKIIYRYAGGLIWSLILSILAIGIVVCTFFFPYNGFINDMGAPAAVTGLDFVYWGIAFFTGGNHVPMDNFINIVYTEIFDSFGVAKVGINVFLFVMIFCLFVMCVYTVILFIGVLCGLFRGRMKHYKLFYSMTKRIFLASFGFYGVIILLNIYSAFIKGAVIPGAPLNGPVFQSYYTYGFYGFLFVLTIALHIIFNKTMKNRVYVKDEEELNRFIAEYEAENTTITDTTEEHKDETPAPMKEEVEAKDETPKTETPKPPVPTATTVLADLPKPADTPKEEKSGESKENLKRLPKGIKHIGGHAFSQNTVLEEAIIPLGIEVLGAGAFANCVNLRIVYIPESVKKIDYNCFFNCIRLEKITYGGTREMWKKIKRGSNWLTSAGTTFVVCRDGALAVDPTK